MTSPSFDLSPPTASRPFDQPRLIAAALDHLGDLVIACDASGTITQVNRAFTTTLKVDPVGLHPRRWSQLGSIVDANGTPIPAEEGPLLRTLRGEQVRDAEVVLVLRRSRRRRNLVASGERVIGPDGRPGAVLVLRDITDRRRAEAALAFNALHDPLTRLPNRALFADRVRQALRHSARQHLACAVFSVDIDRFSDVNAAHGHKDGDRVLVEVAARLQRALRASDSVSRTRGAVTRVGGDEFLLLCESLRDHADATTIASRILAAVAEPVAVSERTATLTASVGITLSSDPRVEPETLIVEADAAMRRAKQQGGGQHEFFAEEMRLAFTRRADEERALRQAIESDQLRLVYQPKISMLSEQIVGVEALVRWEDPSRGLVAPCDFIPLAESTGLIVPLGRWVLQEACAQAQAWRSRFPHRPKLMVSVNVSARQFDADLVETVSRVISLTGIDPTSLCLEVTESTVMDDVDASIATLRALKELQVTISIDDFGTGYSSLASLKRLPLDELKIDKSFVEGLGCEADATAIVSAIVATAHALDLSVVAEGVETSQQLECLRTLGCEQVQGYHFFRPQSPAAIPALLIAEAAAQARRRRNLGLEPGPGHRAGEVALVVDDAADVRGLAQMSLTASGFEVHEADSGEAALERAGTVRPDCVILDVNLPGMTGFEVCRRLREDPATADTTIVMLTAGGAASEKAEAFSLDADEYIVKPFAPRDLVNRTRSAMRRRRAAGAGALGR